MKISFSLLFFLVLTLGSAQEYLYFKKIGTAKIKQVRLYQRMEIREFGNKKWTKGRVTFFNDSTIEIENNKVFHLKNIEAVRFGHGTWNFLGHSFRAGGILFSGIILVNGAINQDNFSEQMAGPLAVAVGLYAVGWGFEFLSRQSYKLEDWRVEYINFADLEE